MVNPQGCQVYHCGDCGRHTIPDAAYRRPSAADKQPAYCRRKSPVHAQPELFTSLDLLPRFEVRPGILVRQGSDAGGRPVFVQQCVDTMVRVDLVRLSARGHIGQAALLVGDSDFILAVAAAKSGGRAGAPLPRQQLPQPQRLGPAAEC